MMEVLERVETDAGGSERERESGGLNAEDDPEERRKGSRCPDYQNGAEGVPVRELALLKRAF